MDPSIFKAYDIRGIYPDQVNEDAAWKIGYASAQFLRSLLTGYARGQANCHCICVGYDMRTHSKPLADALIKGMNAVGANVIDIGMIDTPQIYFAINHLNTCGGIQVTASHNPAKYNGFKISGQQAKPIGADTGLKDIEHIALALLHTKSKADASVEQYDITPYYKEHVLKFLRPNLPATANRGQRKLKIAIDASNGMAGKMVPIIFGGLPLEIIPLNFEHTGVFKHDPNPLIEENLADVKAAVKKNNCDFGICFDGDADRLMVVDENAETVSSDLLTALIAPYFLQTSRGATIVYDLRSSMVVAEEVIKFGGTPRRERVGHAFMKKAMRDTHAVFGGELSGHFYYRDNFYADSALITFVHLINIISGADVPLSKLIEPLRRYHSSGELNFRVDDKQKKMDDLEKKYAAGQIDRLDGITIRFKDWWLNCRPSNTEPFLRLNVETKSREILDQKIDEIEKIIGQPV
jgi:phosphomannomutase